ncbi:glycine zipper 2TM domain-containing protein [Ramlibacter albus]|nr:glycine zipper 2TM domain-containing protein [Ramlibacter albus]
MLFLALGLVGAGALAQETGRVISSTPVIQQVAVPRQVCNQQQVVTQQPQSSGGGAVVGAIVGGLLGHTIGHGFGRAAATGVGVVAGAAVGDSVENRGNAPVASVQQACTTQTFYENRTLGYNVTYEYNGKQYTVQMPYDPGPSVNLQVTPVGAGGAGGAQPMRPQPQSMGGATTTYVSPAVIDQSVTVLPAVAPVVYAAPYYYRPYPYYYPVGVSLNFGYWGGHRYHGHRHWR